MAAFSAEQVFRRTAHPACSSTQVTIVLTVATSAYGFGISNRESSSIIGSSESSGPSRDPARSEEVCLNLLTTIAKTAVHRALERSTLQRLGETLGYIDRIRGMLLAAQSHGAEDTLTRVKGLMAEPRKARSTR